MIGLERVAGFKDFDKGSKFTMNKSFELVWANKDKVLLGLDEDGNPVWDTKGDLEP